MNVYDWATTGHLSAVISSLNRALGQYARHHGTVYVGVTGSRATREVAHERNGWGKMIYLYRTSSRNYGYEMERHLIDHCRNQGYSANAIGGGSGLREYEEYYIYVLLES